MKLLLKYYTAQGCMGVLEDCDFLDIPAQLYIAYFSKTVAADRYMLDCTCNTYATG